jgi:hypothetical protein
MPPATECVAESITQVDTLRNAFLLMDSKGPLLATDNTYDYTGTI